MRDNDMGLGVDERIDPSWDGPMPQYVTAIALSSDVTREEIIVYLSHVIAQVIDVSCELEREGQASRLRIPSGTLWDRDWQTISSCGMTEAEVSFLLSTLDGNGLVNVMNAALGIALDMMLAEHGPDFMANVAMTSLGIIAEGTRGQV